jgi:hypothetical protein
MTTMKKLATGIYQFSATVTIEKKGREKRGRLGYALPGWAIIVDGREINRWSTLARAEEEAGKL